MDLNVKPSGLAALALFISTVSAVSTAQLPPTEKSVQAAPVSSFTDPLQAKRRFNRLIIRFKDKATTRAGVFDFNAARSQLTGLQAGGAMKRANSRASKLSYLKSVTPETHVVLTDQPLNRAELFAFAKQLEKDPGVAYAEIDEIAHTLFTPNDPDYRDRQWNYQTPSVYPGGANLPPAWDRATGAGVVVAVIDSGYRPHADLATNLLPGYDFISNDGVGNFTTANDGDGRDSDASDPGDGHPANTDGCPAAAGNSSWHGTHVAGIIAAATDNGLGVAGIAFGAKVLPVRAVGVCGGYVSDIAAGMLWAAGLSVPGVPANPHKAKVLNLSLGGPQACTATEQEAVDAVRRAGSVVMAATGNEGGTGVNAPANCAGVIAVSAHTRLGDKADYSTIGTATALSAPGGGMGAMQLSGDGGVIYSLSNTGTLAPRTDSYSGKIGTSMAVPHAVGIAALLASLQPDITPDAVRSVLISSARPHPAGTYCALPANRPNCGAGLIDARAATDRLNSLAPTVSVSVGAPGIQRTGSTIILTAAASASSLSGNTRFSYQWTQLAGPGVTLSSSASAAPSFVAPAVGASYTFRVKATDDAGLSALNQVSVTTNTAPVLRPIAAQAVAQGGSLAVTASATDTEGNPVVFIASGLPAGATLDPASGVFTWNAAGPVGKYEFTLTPSDGIFSGTPQTVSITVAAPGTVTPIADASTGGGGGSTGWLDILGLASLAALGLGSGRHHGLRRQNQQRQ